MVDPGNDVKSDKVEPNRSTKSSAEKSIPGVTNFTKLKKFEECRVCGQLEAEGVFTRIMLVTSQQAVQNFKP